MASQIFFRQRNAHAPENRRQKESWKCICICSDFVCCDQLDDAVLTDEHLKNADTTSDENLFLLCVMFCFLGPARRRSANGRAPEKRRKETTRCRVGHARGAVACILLLLVPSFETALVRTVARAPLCPRGG